MTTLYHGTTPQAAEALMRDGWKPRSAPSGGNCGQTKYLYLSTGYEDALWFSEQKGCNTVLELHDVPIDSLQVDPEDGIGAAVEEEVSSPHGLPGKLVLTKPLSPEHFSLVPSPDSGPRQ